MQLAACIDYPIDAWLIKRGGCIRDDANDDLPETQATSSCASLTIAKSRVGLHNQALPEITSLYFETSKNEEARSLWDEGGDWELVEDRSPQ